MRSAIPACLLMILSVGLPSKSSGQAIVYPAGQYIVTTPAATTITQTATSITLSWEPAPAPVPPVPPAPVPTPVPVLTGHVWALAIYDPVATLPAAQQAALASATLAAGAQRLDVSFQPFKSTDASIASWIPHLPTTGLPALLFIRKTPAGLGELAYAVPLPSSETDILTLVNKVRGK